MGKKRVRQICILVLLAILAIHPAVSAGAALQDEEQQEENTLVTAPSAVLMEAETGTVIFERDKDTKRSPASITKIMTLILIFDALDKGKLQLDDTVTTSAYAKSMGGSQVFLEEGETQDVETLIKCIVVASGNDASVAMAEHIAGSEQEFVKMMNERARELGMENTNFEDCCGLSDSGNHYTTAYDVALMSRELITKYPQVLEYSSIWMEDITHVTRNGSTPFTLTNTNKLIRSYEGCVGLKTGSTSFAGFCLSAVAKRDGITLISVVMAAPDYKTRLNDASAMLNYGFSKCSLYIDDEMPQLTGVSIKKGKKDSAEISYEGQFRYLSMDGNTISDVEKELRLSEEAEAPIQKGSQAGELVYYIDGKEIGSVRILYKESVERTDYMHCLKTVFSLF